MSKRCVTRRRSSSSLCLEIEKVGKGLTVDCRFLTKTYYHKKLYETNGFPMIGDKFNEKQAEQKGKRNESLNFIENSARLFMIR